jgi:Fic family protein
MKKIQEKIIILFTEGVSLSSSDVYERLKDEKVSLVTIKRNLTELFEDGFVEKIGKGRSVNYKLSDKGFVLKPIVAESYLEKDPDIRKGKSGFNFDIFNNLDFNFFTQEEQEKLNEATELFLKNSKNISDSLHKKEIERFIIELSWKSSKIEGNTYTLLDTELLIREGIKSNKNTESETTMILNHKKALEHIFSMKYIWQNSSVSKIEQIHEFLTKELGITRGLRKTVVGVTGTTYRPLDNEYQIREALNQLVSVVNKKQNIFEKALIMIIGISYIQPFEDGNKRTGRLLGNAVLLAYNLAPLSYRSVDEVRYRAAMLVFYEQNSIEAFKKIFVEQYIFSCHTYNIAGSF